MIGQRVGSRYEILRKLGAGGMAIVYLAFDEQKDKEVALKVMSPQVAASSESVKRFEREFEVCSRLDHDNIISLYDMGKLRDGNLFYTMDYLPYPSLDDILEKEKKLTEQRTKRMMQQVASAMSCYHKEGIIHRDLKPANIVVTDEDNFVVVDFGLVTDENLTALTRTGTVLGTPYFMSPEMVIGERVTLKADIYALGVIGYLALTGRLPFNGDDFSELYSAILAAKYKVPSSIADNVSRDWDELLAKCMAKEVDKRFAGSEELLQAIEELGKKKKTKSFDKTSPGEEDGSPGKKIGKALSGLSTTGVQRPVFEDSIVKTKLAPKAIALMMIIAVSLFALWFFWRGPSHKVPYLAKNIESHSSPSAIIVTWQSNVPYLSQVKLEEGNSHRVFTSQNNVVTTSHTVTISSLPPRQSYRFRILFPDGTTSLPHGAQTKALSVKELSSKRENEKLLLRWQMDFGKEVSCKTLSVSGQEDTIIAQKSGDYWEVEFSHPEELVDLKAIVSLKNNKELTIDLKKELAKLVNGPLSRLNSIDGRKFTLEVDQLAKQQVTKEYVKYEERGDEVGLDEVATVRKAVSGRIFAGKLKDIGAIKAYEQLIPLSALAMNTQLLDFDNRCFFYEGAMNFYELSLYAKSFKLTKRYELPELLDLGMLGQRFGSAPQSAKQIVLWELSAENDHIRFGPPQVHFYKRPVPQKSFSFQLEQAEATKKAYLFLALHSFESMVIKANVNDRFTLFIHDLDLYGGVPGRRHIVQPIPSAFLRSGRNAITMSFERHLTDMKRVNDVQLKNLSLLLCED